MSQAAVKVRAGQVRYTNLPWGVRFRVGGYTIANNLLSSGKKEKLRGTVVLVAIAPLLALLLEVRHSHVAIATHRGGRHLEQHSTPASGGSGSRGCVHDKIG